MYAAAAPKNAGEIVKLLLSKATNVKPRELFEDADGSLAAGRAAGSKWSMFVAG